MQSLKLSFQPVLYFKSSCFVEYKAFLNIHFVGMDLLPCIAFIMSWSIQAKAEQ